VHELSGQLYALAALPPGKDTGTHWRESRLVPGAGLGFL